MYTSKTAIFISTVLGKISSIIGYCVGSLFLITFLGSIFDASMTASERSAMFSASLFFIISSTLFIFIGSKIKSQIVRFRNYIRIISDLQITSIEEIASASSQSIDFVKQDIQKMIDRKFFANAFIDQKKGELVIIKPEIYVPQEVQHEIVKEMENVKCRGCGAMNSKQKGVVCSCEYCGSPVN